MADVIDNRSEDDNKDLFFAELAGLAERMINDHGREFAMGALVLAARFIAENKPFTRKSDPQSAHASVSQTASVRQ